MLEYRGVSLLLQQHLNIYMKKSLLFLSAVCLSMAAQSQCNELFISEYVEGSGNNKAIEIFNPTANPINLSTYYLKRYSNGATDPSAGGITQLSGTIGAYDVWVVVNGQTTTSTNSPACDPALQALADQLDGAYPAPTYMNGDDAITLEKGASSSTSVIVDIFGKIGEDPGTAWTDDATGNYTDVNGGTWLTSNHTIVRKASVTGGVTANPSAFNTFAQWDTLANETWTGLGSHTSNCVLSVEEINRTEQVFVFPNPSTDGNITIKATANIEAIEVRNALGQIITTNIPSLKTGQVQLNLEGMNAGIYFITARFENGSVTTTRLIRK